MAIRPRPAAQNPGRMLGSGMNPEAWIALTKRTECNCECVGQTFILTPEEDREDFVKVGVEIGDRRYAEAEEQLALGHRETARNLFGRASACYRVADYGIAGITEEKLEVYAKVPESFQRWYALRDDVNLEVVSIPFEGKEMQGYLAIPDGCDPDTPVLVFIAGATGFAEENFPRAAYFYDRGIPVITFDGPGQGTSLYYKQMHLTVDNFVDSVKAVIDFVRADDRIGDTVAQEHRPLHRHKTAPVEDLVVRIFIEMRDPFEEFGKPFDGLFFGHVLDHHGEVVVVAPRARIDKIRVVHGFDDVLQNFVRSDVAVDLVDDPEFLNVEMDERIILNVFVCGHFKERHQMIPVVVIGDRIEKRHLVERFLVHRINVVVYDRARLVVDQLALI